MIKGMTVILVIEKGFLEGKKLSLMWKQHLLFVKYTRD